MNHIEEAFKKLLSQYKNSPSFIGFLDAFLTLSQNIEDSTQTLFNEFDLSIAHGVYLDAIGELVGLPRFSLPINPVAFQFDVTPFDEGYRFASDPFINYRVIDDDEFRRALKAWSITMNSLGSTDDLILSLSYLFKIPTTSFIVTETLTSVTIDLSVDIFFDSIALYNYVTPSTSRLWPKVAGYEYTLNNP